MTDEERVAGMIDSRSAYPYELTTGGRECLLSDVTALMAAVRAEERERCARVAGTFPCDPEAVSCSCIHIAAEIRRGEG